MKKFIYITSFGFLGVLVSTLLHGVNELTVIHFLLADFFLNTISECHVVSGLQYIIGGSVLLLLTGIGVGVWQGKFWW